MKMNKKIRLYSRAIIEMTIAIVLGFLIWNLGIFTFIGYVLAFFGALRKKLFLRKKKMAIKLFIGTLLIYLAGLILPLIFESWKSGEFISGTLMFLFALYLWIRGRKTRKHGKKI